VLAGGFDAVREDGEVDGLGFEGIGCGSAIGDGGGGFGACWSHDGSVSSKSCGSDLEACTVEKLTRCGGNGNEERKWNPSFVARLNSYHAILLTPDSLSAQRFRVLKAPISARRRAEQVPFSACFLVFSPTFV
jgi:hypothetical protein